MQREDSGHNAQVRSSRQEAQREARQEAQREARQEAQRDPQSPSSASTKTSASNGARSSGPSPSPTSFTGTPSSRWTAMTMPPLAVPSSLVSTIPDTSTTSAK